MTAPRLAAPDDLDAVVTALQALARDLNDPFRAMRAVLAAALFGPHPVARAQIASGGVALYAPVFSTSLGGAGCYVSDLWVDASQRGTGLGARLLQAAAQDARAVWDISFLKLVSYDDNPAALAFYDRLGFVRHSGEIILRLDASGLHQLSERP